MIGAPPRFNAGTGLGGLSQQKQPIVSSIADRPGIRRQDTTPPGLGAIDSDNLSDAARAAADHVNGSHVAASQSLSSSVSRTPLSISPGSIGVPQASRTAPARPLISASRNTPAPPLASSTGNVQPKDVVTPSPEVLKARVRAQGPPTGQQRTSNNNSLALPARDDSLARTKERNQEQDHQYQQSRQLPVEVQRREKEEKERREKEREEEKTRLLQQREREREREREKWQQREKDQEEENMATRPPVLQSSKSAPGAPITSVQQPQQPRQGANVVIPAIQPLQPTKKAVQIQQQDKHIKQAPIDAAVGGVAAAEAALTKPKEKRISTMTEVQIMEKLRSVVSEQDPKLLYSKIKKVGQGWVICS